MTRHAGKVGAARYESNRLDWGQLDPSQKKAFRQLTRLLRDAVDHAAATAEDAEAYRSTSEFSEQRPAVALTRPWIQPDRMSNSAFLSGIRGTGKSSVLMSLIAATTDPAWLTPGVDDELASQLSALRNRIQWLPVIDLEPYPSDFNMMAALLSRIEGFAREMLPVSVANIGEYSSGNRQRSALTDLTNLTRRLTLAWDDGVIKRRANLDPESYVDEVLQLERSRLVYPREFDAVMHEIAGEMEQRLDSVGRGVVLVLAIDDFDLNPPTCLLFLQLMRMLSSPRLFYLAMGDVTTLRMLLDMKFARQFWPDSYNIWPEMMPVRQQDVADRVATISANALRKLIPPQQRVYLNELPIYRGINYKPLGSGTPMSMRELLRGIHSHREQQNAEEQIVFAPYRIRAAAASDEESSLHSNPGRIEIKGYEDIGSKVVLYDGMGLFTGTHRQLTDTWHRLNRTHESLRSHHTEDSERGDTYGDSAWLDFILGEARQTLLEVGGLPQDVRETVRDALHNVSGDYRDIAMTEVQVGFNALHQQELELSSVAEARSLARSLLVGRDIETRLTFESDLVADASRDTAYGTVQRCTGVLALMHDCMVDRGASLPGFSPPTWLRGWLRGFAWSEQFASARWADVYGALTIDFPWEPPAFFTFRELALFRHLWAEASSMIVGTAPGEDATAELLTYAWAYAGTRLVVGADNERCASVISSERRLTKAHWKPLLQWMNQASRLRLDGDHQSRLERWLLSMPVLLHPLSGLPSRYPALTSLDEEDFTGLEDLAPDLTKLWRRRSSYTRRAVAVRLARFKNHQLDDEAGHLRVMGAAPAKMTVYGLRVSQYVVEDVASATDVPYFEIEESDAEEEPDAASS